MVINRMDFLTEEEYLDIIDGDFREENQMLDDNDPSKKFIAKMGADALFDVIVSS
jgi:DNA-directed RNA polymerase subunit beta'